jgi:hypothetical protein
METVHDQIIQFIQEAISISTLLAENVFKIYLEHQAIYGQYMIVNLFHCKTEHQLHKHS